MQAVYNAEFTYQHKHLIFRSKAARALVYFMFSIGLFAALWLIALELGLGALLIRTLPVDQPEMRPVTFALFFAIPVALLSTITLITHFAVLFLTLIHAAGAIIREKQSGTWEPLVLTHLSTWHILIAKGWATFRHMLPLYLLLALMRYGFVLGWALTDARSRSTLDQFRYWFPSFNLPTDHIFLIALSITAFTLTNLTMTIAFGLLAGLLNWKNTVPFAFVLRVGVVGLIGLSLLAGGTFYLDYYAPRSETITISDANGNTIGTFNPNVPKPGTSQYYLGDTLADAGRTLLDNGLALHARWIRNAGSFFVDIDGMTKPLFSGYAIPAALAFYLLITAAIWVLAHRVAIRQGGA